MTQYNGTAITGTTVITGDVDTIDLATVSEAYSMVATLPMPGPYRGIGAAIVLANGRDGKLDDTVSIPYPTPYLGIAGVQLWTQTLLSQTFQGSVVQRCPLKTFNIFADGLADDSLSRINVDFSNTYYQALAYLSSQPWRSTVAQLNTASFSSWVMSNESFVKQYPGLSQCTFIQTAFGPPGVKIPVSALTGTITTTVQGSLYSSSQRPQPASTLVSTTAQPTTSPKSPSSSDILYSILSQSPSALPDSRNSEPIAQTPQNSATSISSVATVIEDVPKTPETSTSVLQPSNVQTQVAHSGSESSTLTSDATSAIVVAGQTLSQKVPALIEGSTPISLAAAGGKTIIGSNAQGQADQSSATKLRVPVLTYGGSPVTADVSSHFVLSDQTLVPGSAITISGTVVSLAPDASNAVVGGSYEQLTHVDINPTAVQTAGGPFYQIAGQTLTPGGTVTVSGTPIHIPLGSSIAIIGSSSTRVLPAAMPTAIVPTATYREMKFGDQTYTASGSTPQFIIASQTLTPNGVVTVSGTPIHLQSGASAVVIGSSTQPLAPTIASSPNNAVAAEEITFGGKIYTASGPSPEFVIGGQTLTPNGVITVSGTPIHLQPGASAIVIGSSTQSLAPIVTSNLDGDVVTAEEMTFGGKTYTALGSTPEFTIAGQTLTPNGAITVSGTPIRMPSGGSVVIVGGSTQSLATITATNPASMATIADITFGGQTYTADSASRFRIGGQTLTPGGVVTVDGTQISYAPGASVVIVGSSTQSLATITATNPASMATIADITFGGQTYTADSASRFRIGGQTLTPGGVVTVDGTQISYAPGATDVVVGSSTEPVNLGTVIMGGFGQPSQTGSEPFTGGSNSKTQARDLGYWFGLTVCLVVMFW